jgi:hypothetical protein
MKIVFPLLLIASCCFSGFAQKVVKYELDSLVKLDSAAAILNDPEKGKISLSPQIQAELGFGSSQKTPSTLSIRGIHSDGFVAFYYREELVFFMNYYHENSRMGSCGDIEIENFYRIEKGKITQTWHFEWRLCVTNTRL